MGQDMKHDNDNDPITFISMFSGIEAASVAFKPLGWKALAFAEIEKFPSAVLAHRHPDVPNVGDMTQHDWSQYHGRVDVVCGGPPCQAFSVAGLRNSMDDARGNLSLQYMKALHAISPRNAIVETSPDGSAQKTTPLDVSWRDLSEQTMPYHRQVGPNGQTKVWSLDPKDVPRGVSSTLNTSDWRSDGSASLLSQILETGPIPSRFF